jgi:ferredoxin--NADP+ reductase
MVKELEALKIQKAKYIGKNIETDDTITFKFEIPEGLSWKAGTHFHLAFSDFIKDSGPDKSLVRAFSIMSLEDERFLGFTTRIKKDCSKYKKRLMELQNREEMLIFKVDNNMTLITENRPIVFISMGVGIATFRPLIKQFSKNPEGIESITSINIDSSREFVYKDEIDSINNENFTNYYVGSRAELYEIIDNCLLKNNALYYLVGSDDFLRKVISYLKEHLVDKNNIIIDKNPTNAKLFL